MFNNVTDYINVFKCAEFYISSAWNDEDEFTFNDKPAVI